MNRRCILQSMSTIALYYLVNFGLWEVFVSLGMSETWASFGVYIVLVIIVILIWHTKLKTEWLRFKSEMKNWKRFFTEIIVCLLIAIALGSILQYIINGVLLTENTQNVTTSTEAIPPVFSLIMISVFGPLIEELTFRESFMGFVEKKNKVFLFVMILISIVAFDAIHIFRWQEFFYYLPISICLTMFYLKYSRNVYSSIIMHSLANLPAGIMMVIGIL